MRWTRKGIIEEIRKLHAQGAELNYAAAEANQLNLMRAAAWHFGTWRRAVEQAGIDYNTLSKYQKWNRERIIERIRELHRAKADLSWRSVSLEVDPPLAAAALRPNGFASWREAIEAAGLDINEVARYQHWTAERVLKEIKALHRRKVPLSSKVMQVSQQSLFCAGRRRFGSWDAALEAAGLDAGQIRLRQPAQRKRGIPSDILEAPKARKAAAKEVANLKATAPKQNGKTAAPKLDSPKNGSAKRVVPTPVATSTRPSTNRKVAPVATETQNPRKVATKPQPVAKTAAAKETTPRTKTAPKSQIQAKTTATPKAATQPKVTATAKTKATKASIATPAVPVAAKATKTPAAAKAAPTPKPRTAKASVATRTAPAPKATKTKTPTSKTEAAPKTKTAKAPVAVKAAPTPKAATSTRAKSSAAKREQPALFESNGLATPKARKTTAKSTKATSKR